MEHYNKYIINIFERYTDLIKSKFVIAKVEKNQKQKHRYKPGPCVNSKF